MKKISSLVFASLLLVGSLSTACTAKPQPSEKTPTSVPSTESSSSEGIRSTSYDSQGHFLVKDIENAPENVKLNLPKWKLSEVQKLFPEKRRVDHDYDVIGLHWPFIYFSDEEHNQNTSSSNPPVVMNLMTKEEESSLTPKRSGENWRIRDMAFTPDYAFWVEFPMGRPKKEDGPYSFRIVSQKGAGASKVLYEGETMYPQLSLLTDQNALYVLLVNDAGKTKREDRIDTLSLYRSTGEDFEVSWTSEGKDPSTWPKGQEIKSVRLLPTEKGSYFLLHTEEEGGSTTHFSFLPTQPGQQYVPMSFPHEIDLFSIGDTLFLSTDPLLPGLDTVKTSSELPFHWVPAKEREVFPDQQGGAFYVKDEGRQQGLYYLLYAETLGKWVQKKVELPLPRDLEYDDIEAVHDVGEGHLLLETEEGIYLTR